MYNVDKIDISIVDDRFQVIVKEKGDETLKWSKKRITGQSAIF